MLIAEVRSPTRPLGWSCTATGLWLCGPLPGVSPTCRFPPSLLEPNTRPARVPTAHFTEPCSFLVMPVSPGPSIVDHFLHFQGASNHPAAWESGPPFRSLHLWLPLRQTHSGAPPSRARPPPQFRGLRDWSRGAHSRCDSSLGLAGVTHGQRCRIHGLLVFGLQSHGPLLLVVSAADIDQPCSRMGFLIRRCIKGAPLQGHNLVLLHPFKNR